MRKTTIRLALLSLLALSGGSASATESGWYLGADLGYTTLKQESRSENKAGFGAMVGYTMSPNFAFEFTYRRLGEFDQGNESLALNAAQVSLLSFLPLTGGLSMYARLGVSQSYYDYAYINTTVSMDSTNAFVGIGASLRLSNSLSMRAEYVNLGNSDTSSNSLYRSYKTSQFNLALVYGF